MKTSIALQILLVTIIGSQAQINLRCFYYFPKDFIAFNLKNLNDLDIKQFPFTLNIDNVSISGILTLNLCGQLVVPENCSDAGKTSHAYFLSDDKSVCVNLISSVTTENTYQFLTDTTIDDKTDGFSIKKLTGNFLLSFKCDRQADPAKFIPETNGFTIQTKDACGYVNESARLFMENRIAMSVLLIIIGILLTFFGGYKWNYLVGLIGFSIGFALTFFIFWTFISFKPEIISYVLIGCLAVLIGFLSSAGFRIFSEIAYFAFGFVAGYIICKDIFYVFQFNGSEVS